jgi:hypothetical protein
VADPASAVCPGLQEHQQQECRFVKRLTEHIGLEFEGCRTGPVQNLLAKKYEDPRHDVSHLPQRSGLVWLFQTPLLQLTPIVMRAF